MCVSISIKTFLIPPISRPVTINIIYYKWDEYEDMDLNVSKATHFVGKLFLVTHIFRYAKQKTNRIKSNDKNRKNEATQNGIYVSPHKK